MLQGLIYDEHFSVELVVTQPDRPVGRKKELKSSPVKILAEKNNIPIEQPASLKKWKPNKTVDLAIVAQYGLLIPQHVLDHPTHGVLNVHTSLLPKYRGASPIQSALIYGEKETGVTIMKMDKGLDTGDILTQGRIDIDQDDTYLELDSKLAILATPLLLQSAKDYVQGNLSPIPQENENATTCKQLSRDDGKINWKNSAEQIYNQYRGMTPWPGVWTIWNNKRLKLLTIKPSEKKLQPGQVHIENDMIYIGCKNDSIQIIELQLEGKKTMDAKTFSNGFQTFSQSTLE